MASGEQTNIKNPSWWRQRTTLEKTFTLISIVGIVAVIVLSISLVNVLISREKTNICLKPGCIRAASHILDTMDTTVEPCDDFYNFVCGGFIENTQIPVDQLLVSEKTKIKDGIQDQLHTLIKEEPEPDEPKPFTLAKDLFRSCMNESLIEERGIEPLKVMLDSFGGWPVVKGDSWDARSSWTWIKSVKDFRKAGYSISYIFNLFVDADDKNSLTRKISIGLPALSLNRDYLIEGIEGRKVKLNYENSVDIAVMFGADRTCAERELKDALDFEVALANITLPKEKLRNANMFYNPITLKDMQVKYPYVPWVEYINALLPKGLSVDENEIVIVTVPTFFDQLGALLANTPKRTIANYLMRRITLDSISYLTEEVRNREFFYFTASSPEPRWKECVDITKFSLTESVGAMYVRRYFQESPKKAVLEMVSSIREQFELILSENTWMDESTKAAALDKLKAMSTYVGYPDELMDNVKLEQFYSGLDINPEKYFESRLRLKVFYKDIALSKLRKPVNKTDWLNLQSPLSVTAFSSSVGNSIEFPAGILQGKFFFAERPRYMNYGALGVVIGHEITHNFDDEGRQFDLNGNVVDWWKTETEAQYLKRTSCIIEQYGNYTEPKTELQLNGIHTQAENIADNGGIKVSYLAYLKWVKDNAPEPKLPGLNYTPQQLFWISNAQIWCSVYHYSKLRSKIRTDSHVPPQFRVLGPLSNMKDFSKDFNCPVGSPMNPKDKCEVW